MGEITFSGLATGIDTAAIIEQLMTINSRRLATYQVKLNDYEEQKTALDDLRSTISAAKTAVTALSDSDDLAIFSTSSSDKDILTLGASSTANPGSHSIEINQLATTETWIQDTSTFNYKTDYVGGGNFIYSYHHQERVITAVEDETTLEDFVNLINNDEDNPGVTASLLYQGGKYHLMLSGQETGEDYQITINPTSTEVWKPDTNESYHTFTDDEENAGLSTKITALDQFSGTLGESDKITISGKNHAGTDLPDKELTITANTTVGHLINAINEQFDGVATARLVHGQIWLTDHTCDTSGMDISLSFTGDTTLNLPTMAVSTEGGSTSENLASLSSSSFIQTQNAQGSYIKVDGYPASTTAEVQTLTPDVVPSGGHYHLSYGGETTGEIAYDASLTEIKTALEALSTVNTDDITVDGDTDDGLAVGALTFTFLNIDGDVEMISIDDTALTGATTLCSIVETTKGNDGWIHRNSNSINDAISGITLNLHDVTETDEPIEITVTRNIAAVSSRIKTMVSAYNGLIDVLDEKTKYNDETKEMGILSKDIAISFIEGQASDPFIGIVDGFIDTIDSFVQASDIGITLDGAGMMEFDEEEFNDAINEDFEGVLELLGATNTGNSSSTVVQFYNSSDKYTTAGTYHVKATVEYNAELEQNVITEAKIKLSTESTYRDATWSGNLILGDSDFDDDTGKPAYPENSLQLSVDLTNTGQYGTDEDPIVVRVKQGVAGALEDLIDGVLEAEGWLDISKGILDDKITAMETRIENEEARLEKVETRLVEKFARLEKTLALIQEQMSAVSMVSTITFG